MRDKIKVTDLTTLYICPSNNWGTLERRAIADSVFFRDSGGNSIIFCLKDSYVDYEAQLQDIPRIYYTGKKVNKFFDLSYLLDIRAILNENRFDLIHCYDLNYVWNICFLLMTRPKVPLFLTLNSYLDKIYKNILQRWLFKRIDNVITFSYSTREIATNNLPISLRKIKVAGAGIEVGKAREINTTNIRKIGSFINKGGNVLKKLNPIIYSITPLLDMAKDLDFELKFIFYSEDSWQEIRGFSKLMNTISQLGISDYVYFETVHKRELSIQKLDLFIGIEFNEPFNDYEVMSLMYTIPVLLPRTSSRQELLKEKHDIGESYHRGDARELKDKVYKILSNEKRYLSGIISYSTAVNELHGIEVYSERLLTYYETNYTKRLRAVEKLQRNSHS